MEIYITFENSCNGDIDLICRLRTLDLEAFMILYQSYDEFCKYVERNIVDDEYAKECKRFMFQFQYRFNEIIGKYQAV